MDNHCCLERLLLEEDFPRLANLLHTNIWQRFCLLKNEILTDVKKSDVKKKLQAVLNRNFTDIGFDLVCSSENAETFLTIDSPVMTQETDASLKLTNSSFETLLPVDSTVMTQEKDAGHALIYSSVLQCQLNSAMCQSVAVAESTIESSRDCSVLFEPWFVLSAVFSGCPKLLQYLLHGAEVRCHEKSHQNTRDFNAPVQRFQDVSNIEFCLSETKDGNQTFEVPPVYDDSSQCSESCLFQTSELINRRTVCEFPITDTWIHESVNLLISPLHLACWRHDFTSITLLLQNGANPNILALEQVPERSRSKLMCTKSTDVTQFIQLYDKLWFYKDHGLSPLHFIALGLRSSPKHSITSGCEVGIIHDTCSLFQQVKMLGLPDSDNIRADTALCSIMSPEVYNKLACVKLTPSAQCHLHQTNVPPATCELIVNCLEALLCAGADPNQGQSLILKDAYPLDIFLQPPAKVYYAPSAARGAQTSESLRRYDLEHNACQVIAACDFLLCYDARLSPNFLATFMWRPELLDCFHLECPHHSLHLVHFLIRLRVFDDGLLYNLTHGSGVSIPSVQVFTSVYIHRFIADIINTSVSVSLASLILKWCSVNMLHDFIKTVTQIAKMSGWNDKLRELSDSATFLQMRSLKHSCFYVILSSIHYRSSAIRSLPLPIPLQRELTHLHV